MSLAVKYVRKVKHKYINKRKQNNVPEGDLYAVLAAGVMACTLIVGPARHQVTQMAFFTNCAEWHPLQDI